MSTLAPESLPPRRLAASEIATAIDLGWRVALLHALTPSTFPAPPAANDDLLLNRGSMGAEDRLELELRAIASVADRAGVKLAEKDLQALTRSCPPQRRHRPGRIVSAASLRGRTSRSRSGYGHKRRAADARMSLATTSLTPGTGCYSHMRRRTRMRSYWSYSAVIA